MLAKPTTTIFNKNYTTKIKDLTSLHRPLDTQAAPINSLNPWFITGFTDAEGSFMIHLEKDKWRIRPTFQIKLNIRDLSLLKTIKIFFKNVGSINISSKECIYKVRSLKEVAIIISHFNK